MQGFSALFLLFLATLLLSAYFVYAGLPTQGTIFGGAMIVVAIAYFSRIISVASSKKE